MKVEILQVGRTDESKPAWTTPRLAVAGRVREIVQGFGKSGPNDDSDPHNTAKTGVG